MKKKNWPQWETWPNGIPKGDRLPVGIGFFSACCFFTYAIADCLSDPHADRGICLIPIVCSIIGWAGFIWYCVWAKSVAAQNQPKENDQRDSDDAA